MKNVLIIFVFTIAVTSFYWYVGQQVPQKVTYPPEELEISTDMTTEEMVKIGEELVAGKGTCLGCHQIGGGNGSDRFPNLGNIGAVAGTRIEGMSAVEYLAESLYEPNKYIVEGYLPGMPVISKAPINLDDNEILTVIAYLQSLGGTPSITMQTEHSFTGQAPPATGEAKQASASAPAASSNMSGEQIFQTYACATCHTMTAGSQLVGPSLHDVGKRLSNAEIYQSILEPDATVAEGYPPNVMQTTLNAVGFYDRVTSKDLKKLVEYLASQQGN